MDLSVHHPVLQAARTHHHRMFRDLRRSTHVQRILQAVHRSRGRQTAATQGDDVAIRPRWRRAHELPAAGASRGRDTTPGS